MSDRESPFACDMTAITEAQRPGQVADLDKLFGQVEEIREIANGYKFRLPNHSEILNLAAEFISLERLCCPFFGFDLEIELEGGAIWLSLTGREGVKSFILAEIGRPSADRHSLKSDHAKSWDLVAE